jgi:hypothetical protein
MVDRYTKFILTVIALCLVWISVRDTAPPAYAQGIVDVNIQQLAGKRVNCGFGCGGFGSSGLPVDIE